jgi:hypothetical protein
MNTPKVSRRTGLVGMLAVVAAGGLTATALIGSDHVDTAEVELSPALDMNDVYVFPGSSDSRIVLVMDVASPTNALGRNVQGLDPNALYMFKIDNNGDAREDLVLQILIDEMTDGTQRVNVLGPAAPVFAADDTTGMRMRLISTPTSTGHAFGASFTTQNGMQGFVGHRADPFYLDFEQFVQILPDRRPFTFLSGVAFDDRMPTAFCGDTVPFDTSCEPTNIFAGANTISIVLEMPESMLGVGSGADAALGVWGTISR